MGDVVAASDKEADYWDGVGDVKEDNTGDDHTRLGKRRLASDTRREVIARKCFSSIFAHFIAFRSHSFKALSV